MKKLFLAALLLIIGISISVSAQDFTLLSPGSGQGEVYRAGNSYDLVWDTLTTTRGMRFKFQFATSSTGPWTDLIGATNVIDSNASAQVRRGRFVGGFRAPSLQTTTGYVRMVLLSDTSKFGINFEPFTIERPSPTPVDSLLSGTISTNLFLSNRKVYALRGFVHVVEPAVLTIQAGTIILGDTVGNNSALVINRGAKIIANGTPKRPIVMTSSAPPGQRRSGDWGGLLIYGKARINNPGGEAAQEGGVANAGEKNKWYYGGSDDDDSSGVLRYVRVEFGGIALQPNQELNGITLGGVGRKTVMDYVQSSYANDDGIEWFGGSVNAKHLIVTGALDDDLDTDNGFSGKIQFAICQRFPNRADQSTSQCFEADNDATATFNQPYSSAIFSNITSIGPLFDIAQIPNARYGAAAQLRRNTRQSIMNSAFIGWGRGLEIAQVNTMGAALRDSLQLRNNAWFGVRGTWLNLAGGTPPTGMDTNWIRTGRFSNTIDRASTNTAGIENPFVYDNTFNPAIRAGSPLIIGASFTRDGVVAIDDPFFEKVNFRGGMGLDRWDLPWANYDPINTDYKPVKLEVKILSPGGAPNQVYRAGTAYDIVYDTNNTEIGMRYKFQFATNINGPWTDLAGATNVVDSNASATVTRGRFVGGFIAPDIVTTNGYIRIVYLADSSIRATNPFPFRIERAKVDLKILSPGAAAGEIYTAGSTHDIVWDTTVTKTGMRFTFQFGTSANGPWTDLTGATNVVDSNVSSTVRRGRLVGGFITPAVQTTTGYLRMVNVADTTMRGVSAFPFTIQLPKAELRILSPGGAAGEVYRAGNSYDITYDTNASTVGTRYKFQFGTSANGPWTDLTGATNIIDSNASSTVRRGRAVGAFRAPAVQTTTGYLRMVKLSDSTVFAISTNPFSIERPSPTPVDSVLSGTINTAITLVNTKIYGLRGYVHVVEGGILKIQPGTIIVGDTVGTNSALIIDRGGKIIADGTPSLPIVMTSSAPPGQRRGGDWGGLLIYGKARINNPGGEAAQEGGVANQNDKTKWYYGGNDDDDSSGVLRYVRVEFGGIALQPNQELNGLTLGGVGRKTVIENVQVSYANDDGIEWFGGSVNGKRLIVTGALDDDFDTDNGFSGKVQFAISQRFANRADQSTSQAFESDNDATATFNLPLTSAIFSNVTAIGPLSDISQTPNARFGAAAQIRRNSRQSIFNSVFTGWPRGIEIAQANTMAAALADSVQIRNNSWYGVKNTWMNTAGGTAPAGFDANWISKANFGNVLEKDNVAAAALENPNVTDNTFNPAPKTGSPVLTAGTNFTRSGVVGIDDAFFEKVTFRGAMGLQRWDLPWANYDPINTDYKAQKPSSVQDMSSTILNLDIVPNPATERARVRYELNALSKVTVRIMNASGSLAATYFERQEQGAGIYEFYLDLQDMSSGLYFVQIITEQGTITKTVSVIR